MSQYLLVAALLVGAPALKSPSPKEVGLEGEWLVIDQVIASQLSKITRSAVFVFTAEGVVLSGDGKDEATFHANYSIDATAEPMRFDWIAKPPRGDRFTRKGIFKVEGDSLTICMAATGDAERPTKFESTKDPPTWLYVYKRVKKKD